MTRSLQLPPHFRKLSLSERKALLAKQSGFADEATSEELDAISDVLIESSIGTCPLPFGLATGFLIDEENAAIPMATEEPSVIAAASFAARLVKAGGGFTTRSDPSITSAQIMILNPHPHAEETLATAVQQIGDWVNARIPGMTARGGGYRGMEWQLKENILCLTLHIDVCDAMGANVANTVAEGLKESVSRLTGGTPLMAILTNSAKKRMAYASFTAPFRLFHQGGLSGKEACQRIVAANEAALLFPERAVTHNKGIMNGISALALATGNDTRSVEAGAHYFAQSGGQYRPLTTYAVDLEQEVLKGSIALPLSLAVVGGSTALWPPSQYALAILGSPDARRLNRIAAAVGLAQNLAALFALVTEGIQKGHMKLHAARLAYSAGARGEEVRRLAPLLWQEKGVSLEEAKQRLEKLRSERG